MQTYAHMRTLFVLALYVASVESIHLTAYVLTA